MDGTQAFEEMEVTEHFWLLSWCCNRFSLKDASKTVTIFGITVGIIILVGGAGGSFLIAGLYDSPSTLQLSVAIGLAVAFLVNGSCLIIYNILLLQLIKKNDAGEVFKTVKLTCLIFLYAQLIAEGRMMATITVFGALCRAPSLPSRTDPLFGYLCRYLRTRRTDPRAPRRPRAG